MRPDSGKQLAEAARLRSEVTERSAAEDAVWMRAEEVVLGRIQIGGLDQLGRKVVDEVPPHAMMTQPFPTSAAPRRGTQHSDVVDDPGGVPDGSPKERREYEENKQQTHP